MGWRNFFPETVKETSNTEDINTRPEDITEDPEDMQTGAEEWTIEVEPS
jgi:hypothetical protein